MRTKRLAVFTMLVAVACGGTDMVQTGTTLIPHQSVFTPLKPIRLYPAESDPIGMISGLAFWGNRIVIPDGIQQNVKVFDEAGRLVQTIGRAGDGPGEFRSVAGAAVVEGGRLAVLDSRHRVSLFSPDGTYLFRWSSDVVLEGSFIASRDSAGLLIGGATNVGAARQAAAVLYSLDGQQRLSIGVLPDSMRPGEYNFSTGNAADADGAFVAMLKTSNRVHVRNSAGDTTFTIGNAIWDPPAWAEQPDDLGGIAKWHNAQMWANRLLRAGDGVLVAAFSRYDTITNRPNAHYVFFDSTGRELGTTTAAGFLIKDFRGDTAYYVRDLEDGTVVLERYLVRLPQTRTAAGHRRNGGS